MYLHREIIEISLAQMMSFAGNMLQVRNKNGETFLVKLNLQLGNTVSQ